MWQLIKTLWHYKKTRELTFPSRQALLDHQQECIEKHLNWISQKSSYYGSYAGKPLSAWPLVDKAFSLKHFDAMNTANLRLKDVQTLAIEAEKTRNFSPTIGKMTVGLSSGTSGTRGVFVVSPEERAKWAGIVLARLLPQGLFSGERIAFFLRANSNLYTSVRSPWLSFKFFDLVAEFEPQMQTLSKYQPSVIVAPAQVLREIALHQSKNPGALNPKLLISVAEVLEEADSLLIAQQFQTPAQVYQATEGFLAYTCAHGTLHLNEEFIHIEPEWLDAEKTRMVPIITDFSRTTQPVIRYRLNDVLAVQPEDFTCPCGSHARALSHIEGRCDDMLELPARQAGTLPVFADAVSRLLLQVLPLELDYRLRQTSANTLELTCKLPKITAESALFSFRKKLEKLGVDAEQIKLVHVAQHPVFNPSAKRRRIIKEQF